MQLAMKADKLLPLEKINGELAAKVIEEDGGFVTFDRYDKLMFCKRYLIPLIWNAGWGLSFSYKKANNDKLCVFAACTMGIVEQTDTGYLLKSNAPRH